MTPSPQAAPSCPVCGGARLNRVQKDSGAALILMHSCQDCRAGWDESKRAAPVQRAVIGVDETPLVQPCPHCDKPVTVGKDQRLRKYDFGAPPPTDEQMRREFEAVMKSYGVAVDRYNGPDDVGIYKGVGVELAWRAFKAAKSGGRGG